jgi:hypothetical protein
VIPAGEWATAGVITKTADIVITGGIWIIARPVANGIYATAFIQVMASHDGGASWYDISPSQSVDCNDGYWMVLLGNRVGISTNSWLAISEPIDMGTVLASEVV